MSFIPLIFLFFLDNSFIVFLLPVLEANYLETETMSGGLRTSVKSDIIAKRVTGALEINTVHEDETSINVTSMASASYGPNICDGNIPCLPMLSSAAKVHKSTSNISFSFYMYVMYLYI